MSSHQWNDWNYNNTFQPNFTPLALVRPQPGLPLPRFSTHPVRGSDNEPWVAGTFLHLAREAAEFRRTIVRAFIGSAAWWNNERLTFPILDDLVITTDREIRCGFCDRHCYNVDEATQCVQGHLDYHPQ